LRVVISKHEIQKIHTTLTYGWLYNGLKEQKNVYTWLYYTWSRGSPVKSSEQKGFPSQIQCDPLRTVSLDCATERGIFYYWFKKKKTFFGIAYVTESCGVLEPPFMFSCSLTFLRTWHRKGKDFIGKCHLIF